MNDNFDNMFEELTKELYENGRLVLLIKHFDEETNKKRISCFDLNKENIIGYSIDDEL